MSLAYALIDSDSTSVQEAESRISSIQSSFKHSIAIVVGPVTENYWAQLQLKVPKGTCRIFNAYDQDELLSILSLYTAAIFDAQKLDVQKQFFIAVRSCIIAII